MTLRSPTVSSRYLTLACAYAAGLGIAHGRLFAEAGLRDWSVPQVKALPTVDEFEALLLAARRISGRPDVVFDLARSITLESHGAFGLALRRCETVDHALRLLSRYYALITPSFLVEYRRDIHRAEVAYRPVVGMTRSALATLNEIHAVSFHYILLSATRGRLPAYDIYLPMDAPAYADRFRELAPARVHFRASRLPEVRVTLGAAIVDMRMRTADDGTAPVSMRRLENALRARAPVAPWGEWVRLVLREAEDCRPNVAQVAALVRLPAHTLERRLAKERSGFRDIANEVRHERACALLQNDIAIGDVAHRLGYAGPASFSKAFRKLEHRSPRAYRQSIVRGGEASLRSPARSR